MAVFGVQLVITMVMASVLSKVVPHYSFAKWLLCKTGLSYYLHPSDEALKIAAGLTKKSKSNGNNGVKNKSQRKGKRNNDSEENSFNIPKNIDICLETSPIKALDVMSLKFYPDYQWLLDFSLCSLIVYALSEVYMSFIPVKGEVNLSMLWCLLVVGFCLKVMLSLTMMYFRGGDPGGEKPMVILAFFIYLLIALGILIISEDKMDLGLESAYTSFNASASAFLNAQGLTSSGLASKVTFKVALALMCAFVGAFYTFPGLRLGKMHWDLLRMYGDNKRYLALFHLTFLAPILVAILWIRPIGRKYFTEVIFSNHSQPLMSSATFEIMRLAMVAISSLLRMAMMPWYLQAYLNMAFERQEELKKQSGRITNKQLQQMIARVFYYLCVVTLQYIIPILLCIFLSLMCKTLGGHEWGDLFIRRPDDNVTSNDTLKSDFVTLSSLTGSESVIETSKTISLSLEEFKKIFSAEFCRGVFGFCTWWCVFSWFLSSTFGVLYQSYFTQA